MLGRVKQAITSGEDSAALSELLRSSIEQLADETFPSTEFNYAQAEELLNSIAEWILSHSTSRQLEMALIYMSSFLRWVGLSEQYVVDQQKRTSNDEKKSLVSATLISCILSLINSIMKSNQIEKYGRMLIELLKISAMIMQQPSVASSFRRKGTLKSLLTLYRNMIKQKATSDGTIAILIHTNWLIAKLAQKHEKCRDYLVRKATVQALSAVISPEGPYKRKQELIESSLYALGALAENNDQKLLIWVSGGVTHSLIWSQHTDIITSAAFYVIWRCSIDNPEIQDELMNQNLVGTILNMLGNELDIPTKTYMFGILRRLSSNSKYKPILAEDVVQPMLDELKHVGRSDYTLLLKEIIAGLGSISSEAKIALHISNAAGAEMIIEIAINNTHSTKLVKSCIGALVNLSLQQPTVERIASNFRFYELSRYVLTSNTQSSYVLEYMLRLLVNCLVSANCQYHLADKVIISQLSKCLEIWSAEEDLCIYALFILKTLASNSNLYLRT
jgi:hypothetical protein